MALTEFPRDAFDYVWLIQPPQFDRRLESGLTPIWRSGPSVLFKVSPDVPPAVLTRDNLGPQGPILIERLKRREEARKRGCRTVEGAPVTVIQATKPRPVASSGPAPGAAAPAAARGSEARVDPAAQRQRDSDARRILEDELRREEGKLSELKREYNNGEPERLGSERNYARYLERVSDLKEAIQRSEADVAAIKRELAKLNP